MQTYHHMETLSIEGSWEEQNRHLLIDNLKGGLKANEGVLGLILQSIAARVYQNGALVIQCLVFK